MYRTEHIKYVTYQPNGSGRENYIIFNNGSLHDQINYKGISRNKLFNHSPKPTKISISPRKEPGVIDYPPDGTGRDTYII